MDDHDTLTSLARVTRSHRLKWILRVVQVVGVTVLTAIAAWVRTVATHDDVDRALLVYDHGYPLPLKGEHNLQPPSGGLVGEIQDLHVAIGGPSDVCPGERVPDQQLTLRCLNVRLSERLTSQHRLMVGLYRQRVRELAAELEHDARKRTLAASDAQRRYDTLIDMRVEPDEAMRRALERDPYDLRR